MAERARGPEDQDGVLHVATAEVARKMKTVQPGDAKLSRPLTTRDLEWIADSVMGAMKMVVDPLMRRIAELEAKVATVEALADAHLVEPR